MRSHRSNTARRCARMLVAIAAVGVLALGATAGAVQAQGSLESRIGNKQKELDKIKRQIDEHRRKARQLKKQESDVLGQLSSLEKEIDLSQEFLRNLGQQEALITQQIDSLQVEVTYESDALERQRAVLAARLGQMYERDPQHSLDIILGSNDLQEAFRRYKFMQLIAERDADMVKEIRAHKTTLETQSAAMTESLAEMAMVRQAREEETGRLEQNKRRRVAMLTDIRSKKSQHGKAIARLQKSQKEIQDLIEKLEEHRLRSEDLPGAGEFAHLKGRLPWPVRGKIRRGFGESRHPKYGTVTFNNGVDISASAGAPVQSVAPGVVEFVDWIDAYGKCIIVNHGDGYYTLYAHVSSTFVRQGQTVGAGEVIAEVGDTGSVEGYGCHFEVRRSKKALNPRDWLK
jgi:septal ring factor EnvC (AmiA/AmiB activator)